MLVRTIALLGALLFVTATLTAREPLYVVNGEVVASIEHIPHEDIESIEHLPADEESIARWGEGAGEGVILVRLRYDTPAAFYSDGFSNFTDYLAHTVAWSDDNSVERVSLRLTIDIDGRARIGEILQATSRQLLRRVERAIAAAPLWCAATRDGEAIESQHLVNLQLPRGRAMAPEQAVIFL